MCKIILSKRVPRISTSLLSLLFLISFTGLVFANSQDMDGVIQRVIAHMQVVRQDNPGIDQKVQDTEQQLLIGIISPRQSCSNCHTNDDVNP
jgi:hypothetical protein